MPVYSLNPGPVDNLFMRSAEQTLSTMLGRDADGSIKRYGSGRHAAPQ